MNEDELKKRTKQFALKVMRLASLLPKTPEGRIIQGQLVRCGTSVGANYRAACLGRSKIEFIAKLGVVEEEADESAYWLELIIEGGLIERQSVAPLHQEAREIAAIMAASRRSASASIPGPSKSQIGNRKLQMSAGITLAEIMVSIAILGLIFAIAPKVMIDTYRFFRLTIARSEIQRDARTAMDLINRKLRQGEATSVVVSRETGQPPYSKVYFNTVDHSTYTFWQEGTQLKMKEGAQSARLLADNLRYLAFTYVATDNDNIMSVSVTFEKAAYAGKTKALQMAVEKVRIMND